MVQKSRAYHHRFKIHNPTANTWRLAEIQTTCNCTVGAASAEYVPGGGDVEVDVDYKSPGVVTDDLRRLGVRFEGTDAPYLWLALKAKVRDPITVRPESLTLNGVGKGRALAESLLVENYGDAAFEKLEAVADAGWLAATLTPRKPSGTPGPTQAWILDVKFATESLGSGNHKANVKLQGTGPKPSATTLPISITVASPVAVVPEQLFLGSFTRGDTITRTNLVKLSSDVPTIDPALIRVTHDLGAAATVAAKRTEGGFLTLETSYKADGQPGPMSGTITVDFHQANLPVISLPVHGFQK